MSKLRWRDDALYAALLKRMVSATNSPNEQDISNALHACCTMSYWGDGVEQLLQVALGRGGLSDWREQALSNVLYSWARASAAESADSQALRLWDQLALALWDEVHSSRRWLTGRQSQFITTHMPQLLLAHGTAMRRGVPGCGMKPGSPAWEAVIGGVPRRTQLLRQVVAVHFVTTTVSQVLSRCSSSDLFGAREQQ